MRGQALCCVAVVCRSPGRLLRERAVAKRICFVSLQRAPFGGLSVKAALPLVFYGFKLLEIMYLLLCFAIIECLI